MLLDLSCRFMNVMMTHLSQTIFGQIQGFRFDLFKRNVCKVEDNSNNVTLCHIISFILVIVNNKYFSILCIGGEVLESLDIADVSEKVIGVDSLKMHFRVDHVSFLVNLGSINNCLQCFIFQCMDTITKPHVLLFNSCPLLVIEIQAVGVFVNWFINFEVLNQVPSQTFTNAP